jgi:uncharacterized damage-inducible protein DinB
MIEQNFLEYSVLKLAQLSWRIAVCLDAMSEEQIWFRSGEQANAVGNLVVHLCGNVRQWIGFGVGGKPDIRVRDREFAARGDISRAELKERLSTVITEACEIIRDLPPARLSERTTIQGHDVTVLVAIYQVVEHFSGHTGQIIFQAKALAEKDFGFYSYLEREHQEKVP